MVFKALKIAALSLCLMAGQAAAQSSSTPGGSPHNGNARANISSVALGLLFPIAALSTCPSGNNAYIVYTGSFQICLNGSNVFNFTGAGFSFGNGGAALSSGVRNTGANGSATQAWTVGNNTSASEFAITVNGSANAGGNGANSSTITAAGGLWITPTTNFGGQIVAASMTQSSAAQSGTVCFAAAGLTYDATVGCLSSLEENKNISAYMNPIASLYEALRLAPFWFSYKPELGFKDLAVHAGFGAHQVESVDKRLVAYGPDGKLRGVRYAEMSALLASALQGAVCVMLGLLFLVFCGLGYVIHKLRGLQRA